MKLNVNAATPSSSTSPAQDPVAFLNSKIAGGDTQTVQGRSLVMFIAGNKPLIFSELNSPDFKFTSPAVAINGCAGSSQPPVTMNFVDRDSFISFVQDNDIVGFEGYEYENGDTLLITFENSAGEAVIGRVAAPERQGQAIKAQPITEVEQD